MSASKFNQRFWHTTPNCTAVKWLTANAKNKTRLAGKQAPENPVGTVIETTDPVDSWL